MFQLKSNTKPSSTRHITVTLNYPDIKKAAGPEPIVSTISLSFSRENFSEARAKVVHFAKILRTNVGKPFWGFPLDTSVLISRTILHSLSESRRILCSRRAWMHVCACMCAVSTQQYNSFASTNSPAFK